MAEPSIGDSKKKGIAVTAITAIVAYKPSTWMDMSVVAGVVLIALAGMFIFAYLERSKQ